MVRYVQKHELYDGRVLLYVDGDKQKPVWYARMRIPGLTGYTIKSSGTTDLNHAIRWAEDTFIDLKLRVKNNLPIKERSFREAFGLWMKDGAPKLSEHRERLHDCIGNRYFVGFFGKMDITAIRDETIENYWEWRRAYWTEGDGKAEFAHVGNAAATPSLSTLRVEKSLLNQIFLWFRRKGFIVTPPTTTVPKAKRDEKGLAKPSTNRRPHFSPEDMKSLVDFLGDWDAKGRNGFHRYYRTLMKHAVMVVYYSGLRPNELFQLRWCDIHEHKGDVITFHIAPTTKTGERTCVVMPGVRQHLLAIHKLTGVPMDGDGFVCTGMEGSVPDWGHKTLKQMLRDAKLLTDSFGRVRTLYSFRHTYATERLLAGVPIDKLAKNMGTSVNYIEKHYDHTTNLMNAGTLNRSDDVVEDAAELTKPSALPTEREVDMAFMFEDVS